MARPRADNYAEKQQLILDQAAVLFAQKGFAGSSISTLAKSCNTSKALIYHYYPAKESLLYAMLSDHIDHLLEAARQALEAQKDGGAEKQLRHLLRVFMAIYASAEAKHSVLLNDLHWLPDEQQKQIRDKERQVLRIFRDLIDQLRPDLDSETRLGLSMSILGSINWTYIWFKQTGPLSPEQFADIAASMFFGGVSGVAPAIKARSNDQAG